MPQNDRTDRQFVVLVAVALLLAVAAPAQAATRSSLRFSIEPLSAASAGPGSLVVGLVLSSRTAETIEQAGPFTRIVESVDTSPVDLYAGLLLPWGMFAWLTGSPAAPFSGAAVPIIARIVPTSRTVEVLRMALPPGLPAGEYWFYSGYVRPGRQPVEAELVEPVQMGRFRIF